MHSLAHNELGDAGAAAVAAFLARTECLLTSLSLAYNEIRDEGAASVFGSLCRNTRLKVLDLSWSGLEENAGVAIARALPTNTTLTTLQLAVVLIAYLAVLMRLLPWCGTLVNVADFWLSVALLIVLVMGLSDTAGADGYMVAAIVSILAVISFVGFRLLFWLLRQRCACCKS